MLPKNSKIIIINKYAIIKIRVTESPIWSRKPISENPKARTNKPINPKINMSTHVVNACAKGECF